MNKKQKEEMLEVFSEGFHEVIAPILEDIQKNMATNQDIDRLERKFDAQQNRLDRHGKDIEILKHKFATI